MQTVLQTIETKEEGVYKNTILFISKHGRDNIKIV